MKILVLSDSHSDLRFMRKAISVVKPNIVIHLGDYFDDGAAMAEENPHLIFHQVGGNCDSYRSYKILPQKRFCSVGNVRLLMTHGHNHQVKSGLYELLADARSSNVHAVLYGHTHVPDCHQETDGLWVLNPGACGSFGGSVGVMEVEDGKIIACRILRQAEMETMV